MPFASGVQRRPRRLASGGLIDRGRPLQFTFDGRPLAGLAGDTLASALLANGIALAGRSFKYHRPRGMLSAGAEEPNALVELRRGARREPNTRATIVELFEGLEAMSQNRWPSLAFDLMAAANLFSPITGAGFYYKTFMWPKAFWEKVYEPLIRRAAGLGRLSGEADPDRYEKAHAFCDVLVVGAGPAGLMAALAAGRSGARVIMCEESFRLGGRLLDETHEIDGAPGRLWAERAVGELEAMPEVRLMPRTTVFGVYDGGNYGALERVNDHVAVPPAPQPRQRFWKIVAKQTVVAAGALERPIAFGGNDRPGVMLGAAVRSYVNRFAVVPGERIAVFTNHDDGWRTAADLLRAGVQVEAIIDARPEGPYARLGTMPAEVRVIRGGRVVGTRGSPVLRSLDVYDAGGARARLGADMIAVSGGWNPVVHLTSHHGAKPVWREDIAAFVPGAGLPSRMTVAGAANGALTLAAALEQGAVRGAEAAEAAGFRPVPQVRVKAEDEAHATSPFWHVGGSTGPAFVDYQNDVTVKDVELAHREGFRAVEHLKRYTTLGMASDQGKTANVVGLGILAELTGRSIAETGTTVFRPPYSPVAIAAFAGTHRGRHFRPTRLTPSHAWAAERGAVFTETGAWLRAQWFPAPGEKDWLESVNREVEAVRGSVGICDVTTLGKIDIQGADAPHFLDRVYANTFSTLPAGRARYGVMLREDGLVMDDGTTTRFAADRFLMTTTTANAAKVMQHLDFCHQVLWPELDVQMISVTEQWAQYSIAGPRSREVLVQILDRRHDIANAAFPFMSAAEVTVCGGTPARLFRISFSGELAYELAVPARFGDAIVRRLLQAGAEHWITPYGTEALGVLRIEKGHPAGAELNGQTTARDLGLGRLLSTKKDFIGRVMAGRPALVANDRPTLAGFRPVDRGARLRAGAHFVAPTRPARAANDEGYMTSVAYSPTLGHWIGLGLVRHGPERIGEEIVAHDPVRDGSVRVEITHPVFVDPEGVRLRA